MQPPLIHCICTALLSVLTMPPAAVWSLPITSEPLANSPDHLTWDALINSEALPPYRPYQHEETRQKVPKSIFITPNFNESAVTCKQGYRHDPATNKCQKIQIPLDQQTLLTMQALQAFGGQPAASTSQNYDAYTDSVEYDYGDDGADDGDDDGATGPYHVPLTLSFDREPFTGTTAALTSQKQKVTTTAAAAVVAEASTDDNDSDDDEEDDDDTDGNKPAEAQPFRAEGVAIVDAVGQKPTTTVADVLPAASHPVAATPTPATTPSDVAPMVGLPESMVDGSTLAIMPQRAMTTRAIDASFASTTEMSATSTEAAKTQTETSTAETTATTTTETLAEEETTETETTTSAGTTDAITTTPLVSGTDIPPVTILPAQDSVDVLENTIPTDTTSDETSQEDAAETTVDIFADIKSVRKPEDVVTVAKDPLSVELQQESLLKDDNNLAEMMSTTSTDDDGAPTTTPSEYLTNVPDVTVLPDQEEPQVLNDPLPSASQAPEASVFIVTAKTEPPTSTASSSSSSSSTPTTRSSTTESTTTGTIRSESITVTDQRSDASGASAYESDAAKQQRDTVLTHERNEDARENVDQYNRFVYVHLEPQSAAVREMAINFPSLTSTSTEEPTTSTSTTESTTTTTSTTTTPKPLRTLIDQLRHFNQNHFNGAGERPNIFVNRRPNGASTGFRFPSPATAQDTSTTGSSGRTAPSQKTLFTWLPSNWRVASPRDSSFASRQAMQFWSGMPLIRDPALFAGRAAAAATAATDATERPMRANSKSPTERLFRQEQTVVPDAVVEASPDDVFRVVTTNTRYHNR